MPHTITAPHESMNASPPDLEEPTPFIRRRPVRLIIYAGLGLFVLIMVIWPLIAQLKDPDFQKHIAEHRVMVGMSKEQVLAAWGGPQTINTTFTKEGLRREEWIFEDWESAAVVKHRYLHFEKASSTADGSKAQANDCLFSPHRTRTALNPETVNTRFHSRI